MAKGLESCYISIIDAALVTNNSFGIQKKDPTVNSGEYLVLIAVKLVVQE